MTGALVDGGDHLHQRSGLLVQASEEIEGPLNLEVQTVEHVLWTWLVVRIV